MHLQIRVLCLVLLVPTHHSQGTRSVDCVHDHSNGSLDNHYLGKDFTRSASFSKSRTGFQVCRDLTCHPGIVWSLLGTVGPEADLVTQIPSSSIIKVYRESSEATMLLECLLTMTPQVPKGTSLSLGSHQVFSARKLSFKILPIILFFPRQKEDLPFMPVPTVHSSISKSSHSFMGSEPNEVLEEC